jgi:tetratricopeptide (TPR) repeat protein
MPPGMTLEKIKKDTTSDTRHIRSIFGLDKFLKTHSENGLKYASRYYGDDSHVSVPMISEYDGLRFIFNYYRINITAQDFTDTSDAIVKKYKGHYDLLSKEMGYHVSPPESFINYLAYDAVTNKHYSRASALFKMNIYNYPNSSNVYDSYADLLVAQKDTMNAIANYKKALALQDNADTKRKLNVLEGKATFTLTAQELQKYAGIFSIDEFNVAVTLKVKDGSLWSNVPGQSDAELIPVSPDTFTVKNVSGYSINFQMEADKATGFTSIQPNGIFKAHVKK